MYHYKIPIMWFYLSSLHKFYQSIYQFTVGLIQNHVTDFVNNTAVVVVSTQLNQRQ